MDHSDGFDCFMELARVLSGGVKGIQCLDQAHCSDTSGFLEKTAKYG